MRILIGRTTLGRLMSACGIPIREHHERDLDQEFVLYVDEDDNTSSVRIGEADMLYRRVNNGYIQALRRLCKLNGFL